MNAHIASIALALALAVAAQPVRAEEAPGVNRLVSTQDLNLASPADQAVLRQRIAVAASAVCHLSNPGEDGLSNEMASCISTARQAAYSVAQVKIAEAEGRALVASIK